MCLGATDSDKVVYRNHATFFRFLISDTSMRVAMLESRTIFKAIWLAECLQDFRTRVSAHAVIGDGAANWER
jgi:hypothetical protein